MEALHNEERDNRFSDILSNKKNFFSVKRSPFIDFKNLNESMFFLTFPRVSIESWNYKKIINKIFTHKKKNESSYNEKVLDLIEADIMSLLDECFDLSCIHSPREVSLTLVSGTPCSKLHADFLPLRLVCTYSGPGTVYLPKESTRYSCLNNGSPNKRVLIKGRPVYSAEPFELIILKGRKFNKFELHPCAHRSPDLSNNESRLVLKIDFE